MSNLGQGLKQQHWGMPILYIFRAINLQLQISIPSQNSKSRFTKRMTQLRIAPRLKLTHSAKKVRSRSRGEAYPSPSLLSTKPDSRDMS